MYQKYLTLAAFFLTAPHIASGQTNDAIPASTTTRQTDATEDMKSPAAATFLSVVIPGAGQMYAGKMGKGIAILGISTGALFTGAIVSMSTAGSCWDPKTDKYTNYGRTWCIGQVNLLPYIIGGAVYLGTWGYGFATAAGDASEYNKNRQQKLTARLQPIIQLGRMDKFGHSPNKFGLNLEM